MAVNDNVLERLWTEKDPRVQRTPLPSLCYPLSTGCWPLEGREPCRGPETQVRRVDDQRGFVEDDYWRVVIPRVMGDVVWWCIW